MLIDSHAHIYDEEYSDGGAAIIESMDRDGLDRIVCVGCDVPTSEICVDLARANERIYAVVGVHPYDAAAVTPECLTALRELAKCDKVAAVGEIGLDFHRAESDRAAQVRAMIAQYELSLELELPTVYHIRDGFGEFYEFAKDREFPYGAVLHCFSGSAETAEYYVRKGFYVSFSGTVTYKNAVNLVRAAQVVPFDRLLVETDSPYLTPEPMRGRLNYPKNVALVAKKLAEIKNVSAADMENITAENAVRIFGMK